MSKYAFVLSIVTVFFLTTLAHAVATPPKETIWVTPPDAKVGADIMLNAFVYNESDQDIQATVEFTQGVQTEVKGIAEATIAVPAKTAKIATVSWKLPERETLVTATVTKAVTKKNVPVVTLVGVLGSTTIGEKALELPIPDLTTAKGWVGTTFQKIETFRLGQAEGHAQLLAKSKAIVAGVAKKDAVALLTPDNPNTPTPTREGDTLGSVSETQGHTMAYVTMIYATAAHSFFAHQIAFYISTIILLLLFIRFIIVQFT